MQNISEKAGLSVKYTNHCIRASTVTTLLEAGVDPTLIVHITKHKNVASLQHYVSDLSDKQKRETQDILSKAMSTIEEEPALQPPEFQDIFADYEPPQ